MLGIGSTLSVLAAALSGAASPNPVLGGPTITCADDVNGRVDLAVT